MDKLGKFISMIASMWGFWNIGKMVNPLEYTIQQQAIYIGVAIAFSLIWTFYLMGSFEKSLNRGALLRYGLVPAISWVLNAPMAYDMYLTVAVDREYPIIKGKYLREIEPINAKIAKYQSLLDKETEKENLSKAKYQKKINDFRANKNDYISSLVAKYTSMRAEYKKMNWTQKRNSQYRADFEECNSLGYEIPSNANAPKAIAECKYQIELSAMTAPSNGMAKEYKKQIEIYRQQKIQLKRDLDNVQSKTFLNVYYFYFILFLFGYFIEIKLANASFWVKWENAVGEKKSISYTSVGDTLLAYIEQTEINNFKATMYAVIRASYNEHVKLDDMSLNIVQRNMLHINPVTKKPYSARRYQKKIRDYLKNKGFERNRNNQEWLINVVNNTTEDDI